MELDRPYCILCLDNFADVEASLKEGIPICKRCKKDRDACRTNTKNDDLVDNDPSPLCIRCGMCCFSLSARIYPDELENLAKWAGMLPSEIAMIENGFANRDDLVMKRPCVFLLGKPLQYVNCRAYCTERPSVCGDYLCKVAVQYKLGLCTMHEGLFLLRKAFMTGDFALFNWVDDDCDEEKEIMMRDSILRAVSSLRKQGFKEPMISMLVVDSVLPKYKYKSAAHELMMRAYVDMANKDRVNLRLFWSKEELRNMIPEQLEVVVETQSRIFKAVSELFDCDIENESGNSKKDETEEPEKEEQIERDVCNQEGLR